MIIRALFNIVKAKLFCGKAIIILGPRQSGKTILVKYLLEKESLPGNFLNCDEPAVKSMFEDISTAKWRQVIGDYSIIVIDEA